MLHHQTGSPCLPTDYQPFATELKPATTKRITAAGGRPDQQRSAVFQRASGWDQGVIAVVGWPGQWAADFVRDGDPWTAIAGRSGVDAFPPASGRGSSHALDRAAVLERRSHSLAERVAPLDDGPQPAAAGRQAAAGAAGGLQFASVRRDDQREQRQPETVHRSVSGRRPEAGLLVDGCRLVLEQVGLAARRNVGSRHEAVPRRSAIRSAITPTRRGSRRSSGSSRNA